VQCRDSVTFLMTKSLDPFRFLLIALLVIGLEPVLPGCATSAH
jgi:hypothetical protein